LNRRCSRAPPYSISVAHTTAFGRFLAKVIERKPVPAPNSITCPTHLQKTKQALERFGEGKEEKEKEGDAETGRISQREKEGGREMDGGREMEG
jgi:hypothetical protein